MKGSALRLSGSFARVIERFTMKKIHIPGYAIIPSVIMVLVSEAAYVGTKLITDRFDRHFDISLPIDHAIPLISAFILIYIASYFQWIIGYYMVVNESKEVCYRVFSSLIITKLISMVIFIAMPTIMTRAEVLPQNIFGKLIEVIYFFDTPTNLFPSFHCLECWVLFRTASMLKKQGKWVKPVWFIFAIMVFCSILFVRQHLVLDIIGAILVVELGFFIGRKVRTERLFYRIDAFLSERKEQKN